MVDTLQEDRMRCQQEDTSLMTKPGQSYDANVGSIIGGSVEFTLIIRDYFQPQITKCRTEEGRIASI